MMSETNNPESNLSSGNRVAAAPSPMGSDDSAKLREMKRQEILQRKEKINKLREFINIKIKINHLISLNKLDEAKESYRLMDSLYKEILEISTPLEATKLQNDISGIYSRLVAAITEKNTKKEQQQQAAATKKIEQKAMPRIITTDLDIVLKIVEEKGKMTLAEIQAMFSIPRRLAEEWIQILADGNLVDIRYLPVGGIEVIKLVRDKKKKE